MFLAWPVRGVAPLIFIAWVPLLLVEDHFFKKEDPRSGRKVFGYALLTFFIWNSSTIWWIWNATAGGAVAAILYSSFIMALVFFFFHRSKKMLGARFAPFILITYWITFEYVQMHWDLAWTWLTLGNVFSSYYQLVQWYEYTGVLGGSLWVLAVNLCVFIILKNYPLYSSSKLFRALLSVLALIALPIALSLLYILTSAPDKTQPFADVVVVQPNVDPYNEKFSGNFQQQLDRMLQLAEKKLDSNTAYLVFPETALQEGMWEDEMKDTYSMRALNELVKKFPHLNIVVGASTFKAYKPGEKLSSTARKFRNEETWYDDYNTALQVNTNGVQVYHKSILVPGVEKMPFPSLLGWLEKLAIDMGGTSGSLGTQEDRSVFTSPQKINVAPVICYESVYGSFVGEYVKNGAQLICIITNDGWWGDTPGYRQHLSYASLRAIETRRCIARSANTGISCFIDQHGNQTSCTKWWEAAVIKERLALNSEITFYVRFGDYIAVIATVIASFFFVLSFYRRLSVKYQ